jgi:hypothetical protein
MPTKSKYEVKPHEKPILDFAIASTKQDVQREAHTTIEFGFKKIAFALSQNGANDLGKKLERVKRILLDKFDFGRLDLSRKRQVMAWLTKKVFEFGRIPSDAELLEHRIVKINTERANKGRIIKQKNKLQQALDLQIDCVMVESGIYRINQRGALDLYSRTVRPLPRTKNDLLAIIPKLIVEDIRSGKARALLKSGAISVSRNWQNPEIRKKAIRTLAEVLKLSPRELNGFYFELFGLRPILHFYGSSPGKAVTDAFDLRPWETASVGFNFFTASEKRVEAIQWLMQKTGKSLDDLIQDDLLNNGLVGLLRRYSNNLTALKDDLRSRLR